MTYRQSLLLAQSIDAFRWSNDTQTVIVQFVTAKKIEDFLAGHNTLSLRFENIIGEQPLPVLNIYINDVFLSPLSLYGINLKGQHRIFGTKKTLIKAHAQPNWSAKSFYVSLLPIRDEEIEKEFKIERVSLFCNYS